MELIITWDDGSEELHNVKCTEDEAKKFIRLMNKGFSCTTLSLCDTKDGLKTLISLANARKVEFRE